MHNDDIIAFCPKCGGWIYRGGKSNCTCGRGFGRALYNVINSTGWVVPRTFRFIAGLKAPNICKTCNHWKQLKIGIEKCYNVHDIKKEEPWYDEGGKKNQFIPFGKCNSGNIVYGEGYRIDKETGKIILEKTGKLFYMDSEQYDAYYITGENFGCIYWAEKKGE